MLLRLRTANVATPYLFPSRLLAISLSSFLSSPTSFSTSCCIRPNFSILGWENDLKRCGWVFSHDLALTADGLEKGSDWRLWLSRRPRRSPRRITCKKSRRSRKFLGKCKNKQNYWRKNYQFHVLRINGQNNCLKKRNPKTCQKKFDKMILVIMSYFTIISLEKRDCLLVKSYP